MKKEHKEISIKVCTGTLCHVMGGSNLPALKELLPKEMAARIALKGSICLGACKDQNKQPPFVLVNDVLIEEATIEKIKEFILKSEA